MEMTQVSSDSSQVLVCVNRCGKTPASDNYIMCDILSRLRPKYLMKFKSVCTHWKSLIETDAHLIDLHYKVHKRGKQPLLFISTIPQPISDPPNRERKSTTIDFTKVGPTEVQKLELDKRNVGIPKQTVAGLVCITSGTNGIENFLIYNPCTGERTPWIETPVATENVGGKRRRRVNCIAFGYSPRTKEHKVLCISSVKKKGVDRGLSMYIPSMPRTKEGQEFCLKKFEDGKTNELFDGFEEVGTDEEQVCEVFTVGENTWRRIDAVPPYSLLSKVTYAGDLLQYNQDCKSVYVKGKIYWRFRYTRKGEVLMVFDVTTEKFGVISIPKHVTKMPRKYPQTVELLEVDGHIALVNFSPDCPISLWILDQDDGSSEWSYEEVITPCNWKGNLDLSIEAIPGTNFIIVKRQMSETTYLYNRVKKVYNAFNVSDMYGLNYQPGELREILTIVDSIVPVQGLKLCKRRYHIYYFGLRGFTWWLSLLIMLLELAILISEAFAHFSLVWTDIPFKQNYGFVSVLVLFWLVASLEFLESCNLHLSFGVLILACC
ncbi:hypothetical protein MKW94_016774 [Papaver nudicaule]|uniref:F-box domain-containing protein n=1 Tax=Papaver nudicaule TaxID=74823 RepID=A0AA41V4G3_PAPNU|nr:hypothetical protein [Papaver nudicaule]